MSNGMDRRQFITTAALGTAGLMLASTRVMAQADADRYTFAVIADPHLRENRDGEPTGVEKFRAWLARLEQEAPHAQFALLLGDIHPEKLEPMLPEIALPLHVVHGNHERPAHREMLREMFAEDFDGRDFYSFEHGDDLFVALSTAIPGDHIGHFQSQYITPKTEQLAWLEELLSRRAAWRNVFVYGHVPPEAECRPSTMCIAQNDARWLRGSSTRSRSYRESFCAMHIVLGRDSASGGRCAKTS
ncbi:MAG: metallophosphoesterase, partial [Armatimonadota bacterium]